MNSSNNDSKTPEAASAAASSITVDQYYAQTLQALDQLTNIFSFPKDLAQKAIEECGPEDVQVSYHHCIHFNAEVHAELYSLTLMICNL
jgi:hypothetical protein